MQKFIIRKTDDSFQPKKLFPISDEELQKALQENAAELVTANIYRELDDPTQYETKVMTPKKTTTVKPKGKTTTPKKTAASKGRQSKTTKKS